ncbi:MAG TPA: CHAT domain-containing protein, partial [Pyrinomonadaceae bacterium]
DPFETLSTVDIRRPGEDREFVLMMRESDSGRIISYTPGEVGAELRRILEPLSKVSTPPPAPAADTEGNEAPVAVPPRYLNAGFFSDGNARLVLDTSPLALDGGPYSLGVNVGSFWGPGSPAAPFPDELLEQAFEEGDTLELTVVVSSEHVRVKDPAGKLRLPRRGDGPLVFFDVELVDVGRQSVTVEVLFNNNLLQARMTEFVVVARDGEDVPRSLWPVQHGRVAFVRTAALDDETFAYLRRNTRRLTIVVSPDPMGRVGLRFYDTTDTGSDGFKDLGFCLTSNSLTAGSLTNLFNSLRGRLLDTMNQYAGAAVGSGDNEVLRVNLGRLAEMGRHFYTQLFPQPPRGEAPDGRLVGFGLEAGQVIQVAPLTAQVSAPWELLYERRLESFDRQATTLCPTFREHGPEPEDCPAYAAGDARMVCPHGFWGYRYIVEQLPCFVDPQSPPPDFSLPAEVCNDVPLRFQGIISDGFTNLEGHLRQLQVLGGGGRVKLALLNSKDEARALLSRRTPEADVLYFYTHGGFDEQAGYAFLSVGTGERIAYIDLEAWGVRLDERRPLVVLNACESASYTPERFENLIHFFYSHGAAGVVGTQCEVRELLANEFSLRFFESFVNNVPAGEALFAARRGLLYESNDPRGLAYSLFAAAEVMLHRPPAP